MISKFCIKAEASAFHLEIVCCAILNATRHMEVAAIVMYMYLCSLAFMIFHGLPMHTWCRCVTKRRPVHFILNPGHVEYELGVLMVWKLSRPERDANPRYPAWKSSTLTTGHPAHKK